MNQFAIGARRIFTTLKGAQIIIEGWRQHYNRVRPHSSLGYKPPAPEIMAWPALPAFESAPPAGHGVAFTLN